MSRSKWSELLPPFTEPVPTKKWCPPYLQFLQCKQTLSPHVAQVPFDQQEKTPEKQNITVELVGLISTVMLWSSLSHRIPLQFKSSQCGKEKNEERNSVPRFKSTCSIMSTNDRASRFFIKKKNNFMFSEGQAKKYVHICIQPFEGELFHLGHIKQATSRPLSHEARRLVFIDVCQHLTVSSLFLWSSFPLVFFPCRDL